MVFSDLLHSVWQTLGPSRSLQMTQFHSFLWLIFHHIYIYTMFFIHSSVDGHLGCFHVLAIVKWSNLLIFTFVPIAWEYRSPTPKKKKKKRLRLMLKSILPKLFSRTFFFLRFPYFFIAVQFLKITLYLQLLQSICYIPHVARFLPVACLTPTSLHLPLPNPCIASPPPPH